MRKLILTALVGIAASVPAHAATVYSNNFDAENGGLSQLNYNSFNGLTVSDGTVDLVRSGDFGISCVGGAGSCVDLDGSTSDAGLVSSTSYAYAAGDRVAITFDWSGNQRGGSSDGFTVKFMLSTPTSGQFGYNSSTLGSFGPSPFAPTTALSLSTSNFASSFPFEHTTFYFDANNAGNVTFSFQDGGNDNIGIVIDNLSLEIGAVPEPATWAMMIAGFGLVGAVSRRRARRIVHA